MFKYYNKHTVELPEEELKIIGHSYSKFCLLKDANGPVFAGPYTDCEYVAELIHENNNGRQVPLFLDRKFLPCAEENAVRAVLPIFGSWRYWAKYRAAPSWTSSFVGSLQHILVNHAPYTIAGFNKEGEYTTTGYLQVIVHDRRTNAAMVLKFTHGIQLVYEGDFITACRTVGGDIARRYMDADFDDQARLFNAPMGMDLKWAWDADGNIQDSAVAGRDPEMYVHGITVLVGMGRAFTGCAERLVEAAMKHEDPEAYVRQKRQEAYDTYRDACENVPQKVVTAFNDITREVLARGGKL